MKDFFYFPTFLKLTILLFNAEIFAAKRKTKMLFIADSVEDCGENARYKVDANFTNNGRVGDHTVHVTLNFDRPENITRALTTGIGCQSSTDTQCDTLQSLDLDDFCGLIENGKIFPMAAVILGYFDKEMKCPVEGVYHATCVSDQFSSVLLEFLRGVNYQIDSRGHYGIVFQWYNQKDLLACLKIMVKLKTIRKQSESS